MKHSIPVRSITIRREGDLDDPHALAYVVLEVELEDGHDYVIVRELLDSNFDHCITSLGIEAVRDRRDTAVDESEASAR